MSKTDLLNYLIDQLTPIHGIFRVKNKVKKKRSIILENYKKLNLGVENAEMLYKIGAGTIQTIRAALVGDNPELASSKAFIVENRQTFNASFNLLLLLVPEYVRVDTLLQKQKKYQDSLLLSESVFEALLFIQIYFYLLCDLYETLGGNKYE